MLKDGGQLTTLLQQLLVPFRPLLTLPQRRHLTLGNPHPRNHGKILILNPFHLLLRTVITVKMFLLGFEIIALGVGLGAGVRLEEFEEQFVVGVLY